MFFSVLCSVFSVGLFSVQFFSVRGSQDPCASMARPWPHPPWATKINEKPIFSIQNPSKTFCNLPRALWKRHRAPWSLSRMFPLLRTLDSGHRTPDSGLPTLDSILKHAPIQEIIINNHKPKSFSSSVEHRHKVSTSLKKDTI